jgi:hypothetical protein
MSTVLPPPSLEEGAQLPGEPAAAAGAAGPGSAQRPTPPSQATAADERPQQAPRAPEAAAASAPAPARATASQQQAGETLPPEAEAVEDATEARVDERAGEASAAEVAQPTGTDGAHPEGLASPGERAPAPARTDPEREQAVSAPAPRAAVSPEDAEAIYRQVVQEQLDRGSSSQVAEARARVAKVKAERGIAGARPTPEQAAPAAPEQASPSAPEAATSAPQAAPAAPTESAAAGEDAPEGNVERPDEAPAATAAAADDPDAVYERVLGEERAKGSSDAVALARAKAARVRATKGTKGPGG